MVHILHAKKEDEGRSKSDDGIRASQLHPVCVRDD